MVSRGCRLRRGPSPCPGHQLAPARFPEPKGRSPRRPLPQSHALAGPAPGRDASHSLAAPPPSGLPWAGAGGGPRLFLAPRLWPSPPKVDPGMLQGPGSTRQGTGSHVRAPRVHSGRKVGVARSPLPPVPHMGPEALAATGPSGRAQTAQGVGVPDCSGVRHGQVCLDVPRSRPSS